MATNGKPTTSFTINYGALDASVAERALAPVFIAPRYRLHSYEEGYADAFIGSFDADNNKLKEVAWPGRSTGSILDVNSGIVYAYNPHILINDEALQGTVAEDARNVIVMDDTVKNVNSTIKVPESLGENEIRVGDLLKIKVGTNNFKYANVVDIKPTYADSTISEAVANEDNTGTYTNITTDGTFTGTGAATYMLKAIADGTASEAKVTITALGGDDGYRETLTFRDAAIEIGNNGVMVTFGSDKSKLKAGDVFIITCTPKSISKYNKIFVDTLLSASNSTKYEVFAASNYLTKGYCVVNSSNWYGSKANITINDTIRVVVGAKNYEILRADLYMKYRELVTEDALTVVTNATTGIADYVGLAHPDNPMGMLYACASNVPDAFFYMCSVRGDTDKDYEEALAYVGKFESIYAPIVYKQNAATQAATNTLINKYSNKTIAQFKSSWFTPTVDREITVYEKDSNNNAIIGKISNGSIIVQTPANLINAGIKSGDIVNIVVDYDESVNKYTTVTYEIDVVMDETTATLINAEDTSLSQLFITRRSTASEFAEILAKEAASKNNHRLQYVVADQLNWGEFENVDKIYAAATLATYRCSLPPHAPMNELVLPGFTITDTLRWSDVDYEVMNKGGCWILYNDLDGNAVTYHQITTKTDGTIAEENSAVANGDAIVRRLRQSVKGFASGKVNVSAPLIGAIKAQLVGEIEYIMSIPYNEMYGPQIINYEVANVSQVDGNKSSIMCELNLELPLPLQNGDFYFNLI